MKAKMTRRILALVLSVVMVLAIIPAAFASDFPDVPDDAWYAEAVDFCFENDLMKGTGEGFDPFGKVTREMAVQTLYAMAGSPAVEYEEKFTDVPDGKWYTPAILWGASCGVVSGYDTGAFGVGDPVTREQIAMFFYNFATLIKMPEDFASLNRFPDNADTHAWAKTAVQWAVALEVISGKAQADGSVLLKPTDPLMRAELASILARFYPQAKEYIESGICYHENTEIRDAVAATCEEPGYSGDTYCADCGKKLASGEEIPALGHIDEDADKFCDRCGKWLGDEDDDKIFDLTTDLVGGMEVVIYNPGHGMAITKETDNDWYLVPMETAPEGTQFINPDESIVWKVSSNDDGSFTFTCGDSVISAYLSGTYIELTNNPNYNEETDTKWFVDFVDGIGYIRSSSLSNSYGPAYIECYYNANKDKTNISGYTSSNPVGKSDFGFEFYAFGKACPHASWTEVKTVPATCTEDGYTLYKCDACGKTEQRDIIPALGHVDENKDNICDRCGVAMGDFTKITDGVLSDGMEIVIYNPGHGMAITNETDNNWYLVPTEVTPDGDKIATTDDSIIWTVIDNGDGTFSFQSGDRMIGAWLSGTYIELTNDPNYSDASLDTKWVVVYKDGLFYLQSSTLSNSYGPAYIECYYNANKDKTNISGYTSANPFGNSDFGFEIYARGGVEHEWVAGTPVAPTCLEDGYTPYTCSTCNKVENRDIVPALGHIDEDSDKVCDRCGEPIVANDFVLTDSIKDGDEVVIYNPGHGMAIKNENDNNWYLVPEAITPSEGVISNPADYLVWTVVDNKDGTFSFTCGDNAIVAWLSGTYIELTNDANYDGADGKWIVSWTDGLAYIQSSTLSNSYGPAYIECYYNANKDKTNISGYTSSNPVGKSDFGFEFYVKGEVCEHDWVAGTPVAATCTEDGYTPYTCSKCGATKNDDIIKATGHDFGDDNVCDICGYEKPEGGKFTLMDEIKDGDEVIIYNPGHGMAIKNENDNNWYLVPVAVTPEDDAIETEDTSIVWTVVDNGDGTFSFVNGDNAIVAWLSGTYIELTNDANYAGADGKWIVTFSGDYAYIQSSTLSNSYGPAYIECYYNANKDKTNISGYTSGDPTAKPDDFGFQFYVKGGTACEHVWEQTDVEEATCTEAGYIINTCALCGKAKTETVAALGHDIVDGACTRCDYVVPVIEGDGFVKVTSTDMLTDGTYLIVYETDSIAFNGGLAKVDAAHNNISVTIEDGVIAADETTLAATFEIKAMTGGWSIQAKGGSFISGDASKNTIKEGSSAVANSIEIDENGNAVIFAGGYLMFNKTSGDTNYRFRYYKAQTQQPIQLYKLAD